MHIYTSAGKRDPVTSLNEHNKSLWLLFLLPAVHVHRSDFLMAAYGAERDAEFKLQYLRATRFKDT